MGVMVPPQVPVRACITTSPEVTVVTVTVTDPVRFPVVKVYHTSSGMAVVLQGAMEGVPFTLLPAYNSPLLMSTGAPQLSLGGKAGKAVVAVIGPNHALVSLAPHIS